MKRKPNKPKQEARERPGSWEEPADPGGASSGAAGGGSPGGAGTEGTSGQSVHKSKFRQKSKQEQAAASKLRMEKRGEKLEAAKDKLAKQKPPKKPGPIRRVGRAAGGAAHGFVHGKIYENEHENVGIEGAHRSELVGEAALRHGSRFVKRKVREHPAKAVQRAERAIIMSRRKVDRLMPGLLSTYALPPRSRTSPHDPPTCREYGAGSCLRRSCPTRCPWHRVLQ